MSQRHDSAARPPFPAWAPMVLLAALALWLRVRALPGPWGTDALSYFEAIRAGVPESADPRWNRWLLLALVRGALTTGGWSPAWASAPGIAMSVGVIPVVWWATRRRLGDALALLPCLLWTFLGSDLEEVTEISADAMLALPAALAMLGLAAAARRPERTLVALALAGAALGVGATIKETMLLALAGFAAGAFAIGRGRERWRNAAALVVPALLVFAAGLLVTPDRLTFASDSIARGAAPVRPESADFLRRVTIGIPALLLTASQSYGLLFVVAAPLLARLPFRALRGDPLAAAAVVGLLAFDLTPVSIRHWSLLPAEHGRYFLCLMPVLLAAIVDALRDAPPGKIERWTSLAAAAAALVFARGSAWAMVLVPPGALLAAWRCLPEPVTRVLTERSRLALAAAVLLVATVTWGRLPATPATTDWVVAGAAGVLATTPWLVGRDRGTALPYFAAAGSVVLALAMTRSRFVADEEWNAWSHLPPRGRVVAERLVGRRLRAAAIPLGIDPDRVELVEPNAAPPKDLGPDDRVIARDVGRLDQGLRLADACRLPGSGLRRVDAPLGEAVLFEPAPR